MSYGASTVSIMDRRAILRVDIGSNRGSYCGPNSSACIGCQSFGLTRNVERVRDEDYDGPRPKTLPNAAGTCPGPCGVPWWGW